MGKYSYNQNARNAYEIARNELFRDYELMDSDPIISSALDIYSDESLIDNIQGEVLSIKTDNPKLHSILHNLFYDVLNIEFNLWSWMRNLTKYGDFYLLMDIVDKYGVVNIKPLSPYEVTRLEDHDPSNPKLVQYELRDDPTKNTQKGGAIRLYENYEIAHFRLLSDSNFLPYGKSTLEGARRVWKQLTLMEDAMMIHRIMRAPEKRVFKLDIGNIPPNEVDNFMQKIIQKMKKIPVIDQQTGEYNLRYNVESVTEDYFLPVRGGDSGTEIETLPGLTSDNAIEDIEYLRNKLMAALKIPKAFLGYEEGIGSKATLAAEDVRFARTIERLQKILCSELTKIAIVHLYAQGFEDAELLNFDLELTNPSMIHEQEKLELLTQQVDIANTAMENRLFSREWVYDNIFDMNDGDKKELFDGLIEDRKQVFRMEQIEAEGNDPAETGAAAEDMEEDVGEWGGSEKGPNLPELDRGRATSQDVKDATKYEKERWGKREFKGGSPLYPGKGATAVKKEGLLSSLKEKFGPNNVDSGILNENSLLSDEKE
jgi:hypothetical protein|tara:strand:+ start:1900 stop:3525 length:1626 start_codon:yes stop_codon:yes gene_type:complete